MASASWRPDLLSRPGPAGPGTDTPGAQCLGSLTARLSLLAGLDPARAREADLGLRAVARGEAPLAAEAVRLDEEPDDYPIAWEEDTLRFMLPAHALRTLRIY